MNHHQWTAASSGSSSEATSPSVPFTRQQQSSPPSFFSSPRLDREMSTSSSSSDETDIATPPTSTTLSSPQQQLGCSKTGPRAHYRTTEMLQFEGRDSPRQVWICSKAPSSPLPGYATPSEQQEEQQLRDSNPECYFAAAHQQHLTAVPSEKQQQPDCLHLGHRPTFVHSETVPDVQALQAEHKRRQAGKTAQAHEHESRQPSHASQTPSTTSADTSVQQQDQ